MEKSNTKTRSYKAFYVLMKQMPHVDKGELVRRWTGGRTDSLREMTGEEYRRMVRDLEVEVGERERLRRARSVVLRLMQRWGIDTSDWARVDAFTGDSRIAGKPFRRITTSELGALARKLRAMLERRGQHPRERLGSTRAIDPSRSVVSTDID